MADLLCYVQYGVKMKGGNAFTNLEEKAITRESNEVSNRDARK